MSRYLNIYGLKKENINMNSVEKKLPDSFLKIVAYKSPEFLDLNRSRPCYYNDSVDVISITPVGTDNYGSPLFCYELKYKEDEDD